MILHDDFILRRARADDMMLYLQWANDPDVRRNAFYQEPITSSAHQNWFAQKLADGQSYLYVLEKKAVPAGQIRFDIIEKGIAEIDFSIATEFRGQGLGTALLQRGAAQFLQDAPKQIAVRGTVKRENTASCQAFLRAGFIERDTSGIDTTVRYFYWT